MLSKADRAPVIIKRNKPSYVLMGINDYPQRRPDGRARPDRRGHRGHADPGDGVSWRVEWLEEAAKDMRKLGKAEQKQVLKGIAKVNENPLPSSQGGYGKPLLNV